MIPPISIRPGLGSWYLRREREGVTVRYSVPTRREPRIVHFTLSVLELKLARFDVGASIRTLVARRLRLQRAGKEPT